MWERKLTPEQREIIDERSRKYDLSGLRTDKARRAFFDQQRVEGLHNIKAALQHWAGLEPITTASITEVASLLLGGADRSGTVPSVYAKMSMLKGLDDSVMSPAFTYALMGRLVWQTYVRGSGGTGEHSREVSEISGGYGLLAAVEERKATSRRGHR